MPKIRFLLTVNNQTWYTFNHIFLRLHNALKTLFHKLVELFFLQKQGIKIDFISTEIN